jgi:hypothetical protein
LRSSSDALYSGFLPKLMSFIENSFNSYSEIIIHGTPPSSRWGLDVLALSTDFFRIVSELGLCGSDQPIEFQYVV